MFFLKERKKYFQIYSTKLGLLNNKKNRNKSRLFFVFDLLNIYKQVKGESKNLAFISFIHTNVWFKNTGLIPTAIVCEFGRYLFIRVDDRICELESIVVIV